jgi:tetratricopeptide (TPR) repeat protein
MTDQDFREQVKRGVAAAEQSNTLEALFYLENAALLRTTPTLTSYLGYCLARERRQFKKGAGLCLEALKQEPQQAIHYLNLGRVYLAAGEKVRAIKTLRQGLKLGRNRLILEELKKLGIRKQPVFRSLSRGHPLNKHAGLLFTRLGMR